MKRGVIFVGGLIGTGKTSLAKALADYFSVPLLDIDKIKKEVYPTDPNYEYNLKHSIPFSDETRIKTFNKAVEELATLSEKNSLIVVDETLHKKNTRQILFDGAKKYFGDYLIVWVQTEEEIIKKRLQDKVRDEHILKHPFKMYIALKKEFEQFEPPYVVFENNEDYELSVNRFIEFIEEIWKKKMSI